MRFSLIAAPLVAVVVGFSSTLAIVVAGARNLCADQAEVASWTWSLCLGIGLSSIVLSVLHRQPIVTAWSLAGAVLLASMPPGTALADAVGAFLLCGLLMVLAGAVPLLGAFVALLPAPIGAGMLAGLLMRFVLALFQAMPAEPLLVLPLLGVFLVARLFHAASAPLIVILAGLPLAWLLGHALPAPAFGLAWPVWTTPGLHAGALIGLGVPLFLVAIATQQIPGIAVLRVAGYEPPARSALLVTGVATMAFAPFGAYAITLASVTAALCTGPDAHPDPSERWRTGPVYGAAYIVLAMFGAGFATMLAGLPPLLVATVAGTALLAPLTNAFTASVAVEQQRFAAVTAFAVTASGVTIIGLGAAFWGLVAGVAVLALEQARRTAWGWT